jgi:hypothetical protein
VLRRLMLVFKGGPVRLATNFTLAAASEWQKSLIFYGDIC